MSSAQGDPAPPLPPELQLIREPRLPLGPFALQAFSFAIFLFLTVGRVVEAKAKGLVASKLDLAMIAVFVLALALQAGTVLTLRRAGVRIGRSRYSSFQSRSERDVPKEVGGFLQLGELARVVMPATIRRPSLIPSALAVTDRRLLLLNCVPYTMEAYELVWETPSADAHLGSTKKGRFVDHIELSTPDGTRRLAFPKRYSADDRIRQALGNA